MDALNSGQLSLVEAAALTEFEDAGPDVLQQLLDAAGGPQFDHTVARLRQEQALQQWPAAPRHHRLPAGEMRPPPQGRHLR
jgi:ParB family chromosome partitioning protein